MSPNHPPDRRVRWRGVRFKSSLRCRSASQFSESNHHRRANSFLRRKLVLNCGLMMSYWGKVISVTKRAVT